MYQFSIFELKPVI